MDHLWAWLDWGTVLDFITTGTALAALVLAIRNFKRQRRQDEATLDVQERLAAIEEARRAEEIAATNKADVVVKLQRRPHATPHGTPTFADFLVITNDGSAIARDVNLEAFQSRPSGHTPLIADRENVFPVAQLAPKRDVTCIVQRQRGMGTYFEAIITWEDPRGRHRDTQPVTLSS